MTTSGRFGAIALVAALSLAACDGGGDDEAETKSTTMSTTTTVVTTTTTVAPATTAAPLERCATAEAATMSLHDAWANDADEVPGDDARRCATEAAVQTLFGGASGPSPTEMFMGCVEEGGPPVRCGYFYEGGGISFVVSGSAANGYIVESVEFIAD